jgi:superfamily I DNA and/or RNA helicase
LYSKIEGLDTLTIEQLKVLFSKIEYFSSIIHDVDSINQWLKTSFNQEPIELKVSNYEYVFEILSNFSKTFSFYNEGLHKAQQIFNKDKTDFSKISIYKLQTLFSELTTAIQDYVQWINFEKNQAEVAEKKLNTFITFLDSAEKLDKFQDIYRKSFYNSWGNYLVKRNRAIAGFIKEDHEEKIRRFIALDSEIIEHNKYRIRENVYKNKPFLDQNEALQYSEQLILKKEFIKKRNKLSIRKLFLAIPNLIKELKPVIMMSPITVSNYLKFGDFKFDTVIFDEASQIFPYDAIGCLARGKQVIVAGDRYQLPPTNFFLTTDDENEDIPEDEIDFTATKTNDFESILDLALSKLRKVSLMWHYRSRNESLIAFSNQEIYDNKLITFPSRNDKIPNDGVEFHYVDGGVYDRGKSRTNRKEADKIVELIVKHIKEYPERSLGVVTVNSDQQELVDALLSKRVDGHRNLESFVYGETNEKEPFFIKNIESVQGDERDTIIFGIGYGKDPGGNFSMNFGPINKVGGERRLNVAISRSKINMKVVASVHGTEFRLTDSTPRGLKLLAEYLDYAEKGNSVLKTIVKHNAQVSESGFEEDVAMVLERHNFMIEKQVGVSSFRIDLAVRHPDRPKVYAIGIECDGATYHSGKIARDRDRLRQMVLERLGWKIYRIWSTDWFKNREKSIRNLINAVEFTIKNFDKPTINIVEENKTILPPQEVKLVKPELKQVLYTKAEFHLFGLLRKFKYATETSLGTGFIEVFNTILEVEAPVHINRIYQLMLPYYEREKVTSFVMNQFNRQFSYLSATNKLDFIQDGRHFMPFGFDNFVFRTYPDNTKRPFDEVHDLELLDGFKKALIHYRIMKKEALAAHMFNALNYKGFNQDLIQVMVEKIDLFVKKGLLIEEGLSVKVTEQ